MQIPKKSVPSTSIVKNLMLQELFGYRIKCAGPCLETISRPVVDIGHACFKVHHVMFILMLFDCSIHFLFYIQSTYTYTITRTIFKGKTLQSRLPRHPRHPRCEHELDHGQCHAAIPIYYFNTKTEDSEKSYYGGCGGNSNRFDTLEKCKQFCIPNILKFL